MKPFHHLTVIVFFFIFIILSGCTGTKPMTLITGQVYPATTPESVKLYINEKPDKPYWEIARITIPAENNLIYVPIAGQIAGTRDGEELGKLLKIKASEVGAETVINIIFDMAGASGVAVKFK